MDKKIFSGLVLFGYFCIGLCDTLAKYDATKVTLYTDLVDMIDVNSTCRNSTFHKDSTQEIHEYLSTKPGIFVSKYKFYTIDVTSSISGACEDVNIIDEHFKSFNWTCFSTGNDVSRETNWFFINCGKWSAITVDCIDANLSVVFETLCNSELNETDSQSCKTITFGETEIETICSKHFYIQTSTQTHSTKDTTTSIEDIIAYISIAFILITFIITMLIPVNTCKPSYKFDRQQCLRVPMEVYEMCGVSYKPSTRRKLTRNTFRNGDSSSVNQDIVNKVKAEILNNMGDENHGFNKMMFDESRHVNENTEVNEVDEGIQRADDITNDGINEEDSGDYDTIFFPDESNTIGSNNHRTKNNTKGGNIISDTVSVNKLVEVVSTHLKGIGSRNPKQQRYSQFGRNRCDTVTEEDEPSESDITKDSNKDDNDDDDSDYDNDGDYVDHSTKNNQVKRHSKKRHHDDTDGLVDLNDLDGSDISSLFVLNDEATNGSHFRNSVTNVAYESEFNDKRYDRIHSIRKKLPTPLVKGRNSKRDSKARNTNRIVNDGSSTSSGYEEGLYNDRISRNVNKRNKLTSKHRETDSPDDRQQSSVRPRISITVEFPEIFGNPSIDGNSGGKQIDKGIHTSVDRIKDIRRDAQHSRRSSNDTLKYGNKEARRKKAKQVDSLKSGQERKSSLC